MHPKSLKYAIISAETVWGSKAKFEPEYKNVISIGDCTRKLAKERGYTYIPGCPPTKQQMLKHL